MKKILAALMCVLVPVVLTEILAAQQQPNAAAPATGPAPPLWAFPVAPAAPPGAAGGAGGGAAGGGRGAGAPAAAPDTSPKSVPGTTVTLTLQQVRDTYNIPDWHPDGHPGMPEIVKNGRRTTVFACVYCHLPNGQGRPENSSVA